VLIDDTKSGLKIRLLKKDVFRLYQASLLIKRLKMNGVEIGVEELLAKIDKDGRFTITNGAVQKELFKEGIA